MVTPMQAASDIADAVRNLNHATLNHGEGWEHPGDAYSVIGSLASGAHGLTEALEQVSRVLYDLHTEGQLVSVDGAEETDNQVISARGYLRKAREHTDTLSTLLRDAHTAMSGLAVLGPHTTTQEPPR
ncbi:hypothetical protein [Streptomyces sp. SID2119]|uniref:hypothetical protein n=1 Tax=Streptomyces sp. SID2119 TaxID=2690253 RepID=UPI001368D7F9|nr:hypothetical protein [Streptomyces sp. SID2119]MYW33626.1 hypothetical protein [Streptomyces sp. SID2119]